jgi:carbonic anhydrase
MDALDHRSRRNAIYDRSDIAHVAIDRGPPLRLRYRVSELVIENTGDVVEVPIPADIHDALRIGGDSYELVQNHFHAPSEHDVNGRRGDVEAHFVHQNAEGATAVVSVFYVVVRSPNRLLDKVLLNAPEAAGDEVHAREACPAELLHGLRESARVTGACASTHSSPTTVRSQRPPVPRTCAGQFAPTEGVSRVRL